MRVSQICARMEFADAVSNHVLEIDRALSQWGFETSIFANTADEFGRQIARPDSEYSPRMRNSDDLLIYHYSVYCENYKQYLRAGNRKILVYHNITPPEYFAPYDRGVAEFCRTGRELLPALRGCEIALGDSEYNRLELIEMGFDPDRTGVLPIFVDYRGLLNAKPDPGISAELEEGFNVLFVGRRVPNKGLEDLIRAFFYYNRCINSHSRLLLVGPPWVDHYDAQLQWLVDSFGIWDKVHLAGRVSREALAAYYRTADVYLSMSEHEGFAVPLVESMAFGVPVIAYGSTAIPHTLAGSGVVFNRKDYPAVGELMEIVRSDSSLREEILRGQRAMLDRYSPEEVRNTLRHVLERVLGRIEAG